MSEPILKAMLLCARGLRLGWLEVVTVARARALPGVRWGGMGKGKLAHGAGQADKGSVVLTPAVSGHRISNRAHFQFTGVVSLHDF